MGIIFYNRNVELHCNMEIGNRIHRAYTAQNGGSGSQVSRGAARALIES